MCVNFSSAQVGSECGCACVGGHIVVISMSEIGGRGRERESMYVCM